MSTLYDHAVRAVTRVLQESTGLDGPDGPLSYMHNDCAHRACRIVRALADGNALDYAPDHEEITHEAWAAVEDVVRTNLGSIQQAAIEPIVAELARDRLLRTGRSTERHLVVVDVESNGLDPARHEVVEAAWWNHNTNDRGSFVPVHQPGQLLAAADIKALQVNRYVDRLATAPQDIDFRGIRAMASELDGATLVGANPAFDAVMLRKLFERHEDEVGFIPVWHHRLWDVEAYAAGVLALPELVGLAKLCEILGVAPGDHTAAGDVSATATCFTMLRDLAEGAAASTDVEVFEPRIAARKAVAS